MRKLDDHILKQLAAQSDNDFTPKPAMVPNLPHLVRKLKALKALASKGEVITETPKPPPAPVGTPPPRKPQK